MSEPERVRPPERVKPPERVRPPERVKRSRPTRHDDHWRWIGGPVPRGADAITVGSLVIARRSVVGSPGAAELFRHEYEHVQQWRELGAVRFVAAYVGPYLRLRARGHNHIGAYRRIPIEVRARHAARSVSLHTDGQRSASDMIEAALPPPSR